MSNSNLYSRFADLYIDAGWTAPIAVYGKHSPFKGTTGYLGKVTREADAAMRRSEWHDNIAIRHDDGTIAIDVDQGDGKRGAETLATLESALGQLPPTYTSTARGQHDARRQHFFRKSADSQLITTLTPGQEISGVTLETGDIEIPQRRHRYSVVAPSLHPDTGEMYRWYAPTGEERTSPPLVQDLASLPEPWEKALAESAVKMTGGRGAGGKLSLEQLLGNPPVRGTGDTNFWCSRVAGGFAARHRDDFPTYEKKCREAFALVDPEYEDTAAIIASIWRTDQRNHAGAKPVVPRKTSESSKGSPFQQAIRFLNATYDFYRTPDGEPFAVPRRGVRRPIMMSEKGEGKLKGQAQYDYETTTGRPTSNTAMIQALSSMFQRASREAPELRLNLRVARPYPDRIVLDLAQPGNTRCVVVTPDGWQIENEPPHGVAFRLASSTRPLPDPQRDGNPDDLRHLLGWSHGDSRWLLIRGWLAAALLPDIARPMLFFHGRAGSSKTTKAVTVVSVIDPRDELGSSFGKNERD